MGITKNKQSEKMIESMVRKAFGCKNILSIKELTEGMCNAAYMITFADGDRSVLKIAPENNEGLTSNEINIMEAEVSAMQIVKESNVVKTADVLFYDFSKELCSGNYFFMEALDGSSFASVREQLSEEDNKKIYYEIGKIQRRMTNIKGERFGLLGDAVHRFDCLYDFVFYLISNILKDAQRKCIDLGVSAKEVLSLLSSYRSVFDSVQIPTLVHWDMWEGNVFVKDKEVSGVIDWERALWGEAFMDDRFRRHSRNAYFLRGFGKETFSDAEMKRILWYDVYLYILMMTEGAYRGYEDDGQYKWAKQQFELSWQELQC